MFAVCACTGAPSSLEAIPTSRTRTIAVLTNMVGLLFVVSVHVRSYLGRRNARVNQPDVPLLPAEERRMNQKCSVSSLGRCAHVQNAVQCFGPLDQCARRGG